VCNHPNKTDYWRELFAFKSSISGLFENSLSLGILLAKNKRSSSSLSTQEHLSEI